jgi:multiple sugar transport system permease protein
MKWFGKAISYIILGISSFVMVLPFVWMLSASLKKDMDVFDFPVRWIPQNPQWRNYIRIFTEIKYGQYFYNSLKIAFIVVIIQLFTSSFAAYAFAKLHFRERDNLFLAYLGTMMVPFQVIMIPQFFVMRFLNLTNTHMALILIASFSPFGVFLMRQFYMSIPDELLEAARIDGLNEYGIYSRIMLPLSKPSLASLGIFTFVSSWNSFLPPLIYIDSNYLKTLPLGIRMFVTQYSTDYSCMMAASVIAVLPLIIVFLFAQNFFISGITAGAVKG